MYVVQSYNIRIYIQAEPKEEVIDIDLNDPEVEKAAIKIQAGFKGYQARKSLTEKVCLGLARMSALNEDLIFYLSVEKYFIFFTNDTFFSWISGLFWWEMF